MRLGIGEYPFTGRNLIPGVLLAPGKVGERLVRYRSARPRLDECLMNHTPARKIGDAKRLAGSTAWNALFQRCIAYRGEQANVVAQESLRLPTSVDSHDADADCDKETS